MVYADWLDESGDPRGEFLRLESEFLDLPPADDPRAAALIARLRELHHTIDPDWIALVRRVQLDPLDELLAVLVPPERPFRATGNWELVESEIGLKLPADYKAYLAAYGGGLVNSISIPSPFDVSNDVRNWWERWAAEYVDVPYPVFPEPGGLLPFGRVGGMDNLNWLTVGEPDQWPFVYYDRERGFFEIKGLSAVAFVLEAVTQRSPLLAHLNKSWPLHPPCEFVPHRERSRCILFLCHHEIDIRLLTEQLASHWPADQVEVQMTTRGAILKIEPLAGSITFDTDTGAQRTLAVLGFYEAKAVGVDRAVSELLNAGFNEVDAN